MPAASADERARLERVRTDLLRVHRALLEAERVRYEAAREPIPNNSVFLQLVINDPWFEWVRPMAQLVLLIDERTMDKKAPVEADEARDLYDRARALLTPTAEGDAFQRLLHDAVAHSQTLSVLLHQVGRSHPG